MLVMLFSIFLCLFFLLSAVFVEAALDVSTLAREVARVESVRRVKDLQRQLSHFAQYGQWNSISQLFSINSTLIWGNVTAHGPASIETWLRNDSGNMNGLVSGSLSTMIVETPVVSLSIDGKRAKGRWNGIWFQGDGKGGTRIQGGVYENEYILMDNRWHVSLLHYYDMYKGDYENGWRNVDGKGISIVPYHFTAEGSGLPIPPAVGDPEPYNGTIEQLGARIQRLNDEDDVRNLMHAHGYYVDRRMWSDVVDLHTANTTVRIGNETTLRGKTGVRQFLKRMGPEGLTQGVNNDHPIFDMIVEVEENGREAIARGTEIAMLGDVNRQVASWEFNVFRNRIVKENGVWKVQDIVVAPQIVADYYIGWGQGGLKPSDAVVPPFLNVTSSPVAEGSTTRSTNVTVNDLKRRLRRSAACDGSENLSHAYGYYADDILGEQLGELFAKNGHKASPFAGFFHTPERITGAMKASYGTNRSALRSSISFHWRLQPVIIVSEDGRSASLRARLLQPSTSVNKAGSFNSAIYQDQIVSENGKWKFWSVTIDEFYWQSSSWKSGWSMVTQQNSTQPDPPAWTRRYPPDLTIADVGERENWVIPRGLKVVTSNFNDRLQQYETDDTIVYFKEASTDATIVSGCLNLTAAVVALIAWSTLRKPDMDSQYNISTRRFWMLSIVVTTLAGSATALSAVVLHYTERGDDQWGCSSERLMMSGKLNTNQYCTREMAACNYQPGFVPRGDRENTSIACTEAVTVKWLQIVMIVNALIILVMFSLQARLRRKSREARLNEPVPEERRHHDDGDILMRYDIYDILTNFYDTLLSRIHSTQSIALSSEFGLQPETLFCNLQ
ncbi:unnamed protein product [Alternaria alternata]